MVDILGLHGIGQQQRGRYQMLPDWQAGLNDGVERAKGYGWPTPSLDLAYYGDLFLPETDSKGDWPDMDDKGGPALDNLDDDLVSFFEDVEGEVVDRTEPVDEIVPAV